MSEKYPKLKLKRKKTAIPEAECERYPSTTVQRDNEVPTPFSPREACEKLLSAGDPYDSNTGVWWDRPNLQDVENLWAVTLKSAFPNLGQGVWETVPDLPLASPVACCVEQQTGWRWCGLSEEVGPLPSPPKLSANSPAVLDAHSPSHQLRPTDPNPLWEGAETPPYPSHRKGHLNYAPVREEPGAGTSMQTPGPVNHLPGNETRQRPQSPRSPWKAAGDGGRRDRAGGGAREGTVATGRASLEGVRTGGAGGGVIKRQLPARAWDGPDSCAPAGEPGRAKSPAGEADVSGNVGADWDSVRGAAAAAATAMESCPMCLLPFPRGFTQMECDSHLATCLSEMSEDITW
ncbi:hypothetical protein AAFF_G00147160 [Aldrovandia affinis]|uniref:UBZ2-type domain-containing protein n=1 Tax=Aldrovandia affinis TaxID=143900 RepID=A0AAD7RQ46_9TELE|nr:hypothetical protein AAFF_G00147160 [Aldrovandia affinis]